MKHRKLTAALLALLLAAGGAAGAEVVEVTGTGEDSESALRDAKRNAVETVLGTYIDSKTIVDKAVVIEDEIYAKSAGFAAVQKILSEGEEGGVYTVRARIDVDTNPNSALLGKIEMLRALEDPRIAVIVTYYSDLENAGREKYPQMCESAVNSRLADLGFQHVTAAAAVLTEKGTVRSNELKAADLLPTSSVDYLILGKLDLHTNNIMLPKYKELAGGGTAGTFATNLMQTTAELNADVIKADTSEVVDSFRVETKAIQGNDNNAENAAMQQLGRDAAQKIQTIFAKAATSVENNVQFIAETDDGDAVSALTEALKNLSCIRSVKLSEYRSGRAVLLLDTDVKPQTVLRLLKEEVKYKLNMKNATVNSVTVTVE